MSSTLYVSIWVCWKLTQGIKYLIKEYDKISSYNLRTRKIKQNYIKPKSGKQNNKLISQPPNPLTFAMLYRASQA